MKPARIIILVVALAAGGLAAMLASGPEPAPTPAPVKAMVETVDVLVAKTDIGMGQVVGDKEMGWQAWPASLAAQPSFIRRSDSPNALVQFTGSIARGSFVAGEPIREAKLVKPNGSGFMAAILPSGMRAISTEISPETGAGGFILPNDRVDVILTRKERLDKTDRIVSQTILSDIRVLAIDQMIEEKGGQKVVVGKTATLELSSRQAETLALSRQQGSLTLALRSMVDTGRATKDTGTDDADRTRRAIDTVRFGVGTSTEIK